MSQSTNQDILSWKVVENFITQRMPTDYDNSTKLNRESQLLLRDAYTLWYLVTVDTLSSFGTPLTPSVQNEWLIAVCNEPVAYLVESLKECARLFVDGEFNSYNAFKQHIRGSNPRIGTILVPIRKIIDDWYSNSNINSLDLIYSWCQFLSRLNLKGIAKLEIEALSKYLEIEGLIQQSNFTLEEKDLLQKWFPRTLKDCDFFIKNHNPQHGPGCTSDAGRCQQDKYQSLCLDAGLTMLNRRLGEDGFAYPRNNGKLLKRESRTIFVPKSAGSYRTISMEPATLMWHQKGVRSALIAYFKATHHYIYKRRFQPEDQSPNRELAQLGSLYGDFSTIDLTSASDTVSWSLVKEWFGNTSLYPWILWTRSTHTLLPNGNVIKLQKFAPMGSDLCFPVETIIFAAITECAIRECGGNPKKSHYRIYGDDIVVEEEYSAAVLRRLVQNGFTPNWNKTYSGTQPKGFFRESCGGFYFNGVDITPVRLSRRFSGYSVLGSNTPKRIESIIQLANDCTNRYPSVRRFLVKRLISLPIHLRPLFSADGKKGLYSLQPTNFHLQKKSSPALQTYVFIFGNVKSPKRTRDRDWEDIRYYEYQRQANHRQRLVWPEDRIDVDVSPIGKLRWFSKKSSLY